ncbi:MAG: lipid A biosynthesis acyltransferase, partial [Gammaproteobacteria bacterium]|nr:lipid A biosynthesis acyltransferase [Gammaproteobacteria bacterium]
DRTWTLRFEPPLSNFPSGDELQDAVRVNQAIEAAVRRRPEQYLWLHRRFKTRPPGELGLYGP